MRVFQAGISALLLRERVLSSRRLIEKIGGWEECAPPKTKRVNLKHGPSKTKGADRRKTRAYPRGTAGKNLGIGERLYHRAHALVAPTKETPQA